MALTLIGSGGVAFGSGGYAFGVSATYPAYGNTPAPGLTVPPDRTAAVAPVSTEETSPTRVHYTGEPFGTGLASEGRMIYTYSGSGSMFYDVWFIGTGFRIKSYKHPDGGPFPITVDYAQNITGDNYATSATPNQVLAEVTGLTQGVHILQVFTSGSFVQSDLIEFF